MTPDKFVDSLVALIYRILNRPDAPMAKVAYGVFQNNNALDANLCDVELLDGSLIQGCPRIGTPTFTTNAALLLVKGPGVSYIVLGEVKGNVGAYTSTPLVQPDIYVKTYDSTWSRSFNSAGTFLDDNILYQGYNPTAADNRKSAIGFDHAQIATDLTGSTVLSCKLKLTYTNWYMKTGGTAVIGTHNTSSVPSTFPTATTNRVQSSSWPRNLTRKVELGTTIGGEFKAGTTKGVVLGPGPTTEKQYYGYANGSAASDVQLEITYSTP